VKVGPLVSASGQTETCVLNLYPLKQGQRKVELCAQKVKLCTCKVELCAWSMFALDINTSKGGGVESGAIEYLFVIRY
jgi:hypothetical protein